MEKKFNYTMISYFCYSGVFFTIKGDFLSMITDYDFNETDSPDPEQNY